MARWYFDLIGEKQDRWVWREIDQHEHDQTIRISVPDFAYYLECVADAERHGYKRPHPKVS